jgi:hypothetical protein
VLGCWFANRASVLWPFDRALLFASVPTDWHLSVPCRSLRPAPLRRRALPPPPASFATFACERRHPCRERRPLSQPLWRHPRRRAPSTLSRLHTETEHFAVEVQASDPPRRFLAVLPVPTSTRSHEISRGGRRCSRRPPYVPLPVLPLRRQVVPNASTGVPEFVCSDASAEIVMAPAGVALAAPRWVPSRSTPPRDRTHSRTYSLVFPAHIASSWRPLATEQERRNRSWPGASRGPSKLAAGKAIWKRTGDSVEMGENLILSVLFFYFKVTAFGRISKIIHDRLAPQKNPRQISFLGQFCW